MLCPVCPGICRCGDSSAAKSSKLNERASVVTDPEQYDPSEERFAASLEGAAEPRERMAGVGPLATAAEGEAIPTNGVAEPLDKSSEPGASAETARAQREGDAVDTGVRETLDAAPFETALHAERLAQLRPARRAIVLGEPKNAERTLEPGEWRQEISSRVNSYRARRRPRAERPRSLNLNFDPVTSFPPAPPLPIPPPAVDPAAVPLSGIAEPLDKPGERGTSAGAREPDARAQQRSVAEPLDEPGEQGASAGAREPDARAQQRSVAEPLDKRQLMAMHIDAFAIERCWPNPAPCNPNPFWKRATKAAAASFQDHQSQAEPAQMQEGPVVQECLAAEPDAIAQPVLEPSEIPTDQLNAEIIAKLGEAIGAAEKRGDQRRVIEFPAAPLPFEPADELAEPVVTAPRIFEEEEITQAELAAQMEATVQATPPIATVELPAPPLSAQPAHEIQSFLPIAPIRLRAAMEAVDFGISATGFLLFAVILMWFGALPAGRSLVVMVAILPGVFWWMYEYLFLVNAGSTLGMRLTGLRLTGFESREVSESRRRARALSMAVSTLALGLGFAWALLDQDRLGWHDRASETFLTRRTQNGS